MQRRYEIVKSRECDIVWCITFMKIPDSMRGFWLRIGDERKFYRFDFKTESAGACFSFERGGGLPLIYMSDVMSLEFDEPVGEVRLHGFSVAQYESLEYSRVVSDLREGTHVVSDLVIREGMVRMMLH